MIASENYARLAKSELEKLVQEQPDSTPLAHNVAQICRSAISEIEHEFNLFSKP